MTLDQLRDELICEKESYDESVANCLESELLKHGDNPRWHQHVLSVLYSRIDRKLV